MSGLAIALPRVKLEAVALQRRELLFSGWVYVEACGRACGFPHVVAR